MRRLLPIGFLALALAALAAPVGAAGPDSNLGADVNGGGCHPQPVTGDLFSQLLLVDPEWSPVINGPVIDSTPVLIHGTVVDVHGLLGGDFPSTHISSDMVAELDLDAADLDRRATGNGSHLAIEWEARALPPFAWPGEGDKTVALGRWIFDCGHPDAIPGACSTTTSQPCVANADCTAPGCPSCVTGETCNGTTYRYSSEVHPPHAIASIREGRGYKFRPNGSKPPIAVTRVDVYVNAFAGGAGDRCVLTHHADYFELLTVECYPLSDPVAQINAQDFSFDIPLPPPPVAGGGLKKKVIRYPKSVGGRRAGISFKKFLDDPQPHLTATVRMTSPKQPTEFAGTILVGWAKDTTPLTHVRVTLQSLKVNNPVRSSTVISPKTCSTANTACATNADCPMGEFCLGIGQAKGWYLDSSVNGEWQSFVNLDDLDAGDEITENLVYDQYLAAGDDVHIVAQAKSQECIDLMYGKSLHQDLSEQGLGKGANCLFSASREAGVVDVAYAGPDFGGGVGGSTDYDTPSTGGQGGHCSMTTGTLCVGNGDCPLGETCAITGGSFNLKYRIERLP